MTDLTLIGLGAMGSALARALLGAGHRLTVWNRTAAKCEALARLGAEVADSAAAAVAASPVVAICIDNYLATRALIQTGRLEEPLAGRILIQLSTGTPSEAAELDRLVRGFGGVYIDGAIMPDPDEIGSPGAQILFAGPEREYRRLEPMLDCLGGDLRYLGEQAGTAAALDMALLTQELCSYLGAIHGALLCEAEGLDPGLLAALYPPGHVGLKPLHVIEANRYTQAGATLTVWEAAVQRIQGQARDSKINSEIPDLISSLMRRAIAAGHGDEGIAAIIKILRGEIALK